jgi:uncharacterized membrane protein
MLEQVLLLVLLFLPLAAGVLVALLGEGRAQQVRWISALTSVICLGLALFLAGRFMALDRTPVPEPGKDLKAATVFTFEPEFVPGSPGKTLDAEGKAVPNPHGTTWQLIPLGQGAIQFFIGLDGLNVWLVVLNALLMLPAVLISWNHITERVHEFYAWLLILQTTMIGVFLAFDIVLFYIFFELTLIPLFFLIGIWGGPERRYAIRRGCDQDDGRLCLDDSKEVYSAAQGLDRLETGVLSLLPKVDSFPYCLNSLLEELTPTCHQELRQECWYRGDTMLPLAAEKDPVLQGRASWSQACQPHPIRIALVRSLTVCPPRFNELTDRWGTKAAILGLAFAELAQACAVASGQETLHIVADKHGGRNFYSALVQHAFPQGFVVMREEGAARSVYEVNGMDRPIRVTFMPRADGAELAVALASMVSKYLRETLMHEFNRFWRERIPGLAPTAGYPVDARRFIEGIRPTLKKMGLDEARIWRNK